MDHKPSKYQEAFFKEIRNGDSDILVEAVAGSGKSFVLKNSIKLIPSSKSIIVLAFNKSIAEEMKLKLPSRVDCSTLHSLGMKILRQNFKWIKVSESKYFKFISPEVDKYTLSEKKRIEEEGSDEKPVNAGQLKYKFKVILDLYRVNVCKDIDDVNMILEKYGMNFNNKEIGIFMSIIKKVEKYNSNPNIKGFLVDFTDMLYLPILYNIKIPKYDYVMIDECQDLSKLQLRLVDSLKNKEGRSVYVGDEHQCQPEGTLVKNSLGEDVDIKDLSIGDRVGSFHRNDGQYKWIYKSPKRYKNNIEHCPEVLEKSERKYTGNLYTVNSGESRSSYTDNHKCIYRVKYVEAWIIYLMEKDGKFRIGKSKWFSKSNGMGIKGRFGAERADRLWILESFFSEEDALLKEQYYSYKFGIPQLRFRENNYKDQSRMEKYWSQFDADGDLIYSRGIKILSYFNRRYEYPLLKSREGEGGRFGSVISDIYSMMSSNYMCCTQACNLIEGVMEVSHYSSLNRSHNWKDISSIDIEKVEDIKVYSIKVSKTELYVADGILTHNSIYGFAGADSESFNDIKGKMKIKHMPLSVSYRCPENIIKHVNYINPDIEWDKENTGGEVVYEGNFDDIKSGDMVLCRNTKPLIKLYMEFISDGVKAYIKGRDIGENIIKLLDPYKTLSSKGTDSKLKVDLEKYAVYLKSKGVKSPYKTEEYFDLKEKHDICRIFLDQVPLTKAAISNIQTIFQEKGDGIILSTIHKAKGLEANNVYIVRRDLIPSRFADQDWMIEQERNLLYVAVTRPKNKLIYVSNKIFPAVDESHKDYNTIYNYNTEKTIKFWK